MRAAQAADTIGARVTPTSLALRRMTSFERAQLTFCDFSRAKITKTQLYRTDFGGTDFGGSKRVGVDFTGADMRDSMLRRRSDGCQLARREGTRIGH